MASALVGSIRDRTLAEDIVLYSWARHLTLTVPISTQVSKWVPANLMLGVTLRWISILSRGSRNTGSRVIQKFRRDQGHLGLVQTTSFQYCSLNFSLTCFSQLVLGSVASQQLPPTCFSSAVTPQRGRQALVFMSATGSTAGEITLSVMW